MGLSLGKILKFFGEILILIGKNLPLSSAISQVASNHNLSESEVWSIWDKHGK